MDTSLGDIIGYGYNAWGKIMLEQCRISYISDGFLLCTYSLSRYVWDGLVELCHRYTMLERL